MTDVVVAPTRPWRNLFLGHRRLLESTSVLLLQLVVVGVTGFLFWLVAARRFDTDAIGEASALLTLVLFTNYATSLGLPIAVARFGGSDTDDARGLMRIAILTTSVFSMLGAVIVGALASDDFAAPLIEHGRLVGILLFFLAVNGFSISTLLDHRQLALGQDRAVLFRNGVFALIRIPLLFVVLLSDSLWVWCAAALSAPLAVVVSLIVHGGVSSKPIAVEPSVRTAATRFALVNYASQLLSQAPFVTFPVIVLAIVDATDNASFHVAWTAAALVFLVPTMIARALLIEGATDRAVLATQARLSIVLGLVFGVVAIAASIPIAFLLPTFFGDDYAAARDLLPLLVGGLIPFAITSTALTVARVRSAHRATIAISLTLGLAVLVPSFLLTMADGTVGAARAWLAGHILTAVIGIVVIRASK